MSKASSLVKNTVIIAVGKTSSQVINFLLLPLYTYYLTPSQYGLVDLFITYIVLLVPALTLQIETASFRYLVDAREDEKERIRVISNIVRMAIPLSLPWLVVFAVIGIFTGFAYTWSILVASTAVLLFNIVQQIARGLGENKQFAIASIISGLVTFLGALMFIVWLSWGINGMLLSIALANMVSAVYLIITLKLYKDLRLDAKDLKLQSEMLGYSIPLVPNGVSWWVINVSDRTIISVMIGVAVNGIYAVASKYASILNAFNDIFIMSWTEAASLHIDSSDRNEFFSRVANVAVRLFGAGGLGLIATMPFIFPLMVSEEFSDAYLYIPVLVIGVFFGTIVSVYSAIYVAKKKTKQVMNTSLASAVINIVLTIALVPFFGLYAAAGSTVIAYLAMAIYRHYDAKKYVKITYEKRVFVILFVLYVAVMILYYMHTLWASVVALVVAVVAAWWLNRRELGRMKSLVGGKLGR